MDPFDSTNFRPAPSQPCCACGGAACCLTMPTWLIDQTPPNGLYNDLFGAQEALTNFAAGCYAETYRRDSIGAGSMGSTFSGGILSVFSNTAFAAGQEPHDKTLSRVYLKAADGLSVIYNLTSTFGGSPGPSQYLIALYADDQRTLIDSVSNFAPISGTFSPVIPADGFYYIYTEVLQAHDAGTATISISFTATGGSSFAACPVRAAYQDGSGGELFVKPDSCPDCGPECFIECASHMTSDCDFPPPRDGADCCSQASDIPCIDPPGAGHVIQTAKARLWLTGLTIGANYVATIYFCQFDFGNNLLGTSSTTIIFTATAVEERTAYYDVPDATYNTNFWCACGCDVLLAA